MNFQDKIRDPNCALCPLHEEAEYVCLMGSGKKKAKLMIVGEAPGAREDEQHAAFVGPAGKLLTELLQEVGISRKDCYITNAVKCRPKENATPSRSEVKECSTYLAKEIQAVKPTIILALGNTALQATTGKSGITKHRGKINDEVFATFHPAAALRSSHYLPQIRSDLQAVARQLGGDDVGVQTRTRLINSPTKLELLVKKLESSSEIAFDVETTGLHEWVEGSRIVTLGVSWAPGEAAVIPLWHSSLIKVKGWIEYVIQRIKLIFEDIRKKFIAHNAKFDAKWMAKEGIYVPVTFDTMIAAHLLDENRVKGLKPLSEMLLGVDGYNEDTKDCYNADLRKLAIYNGKDCDYTLRLYHIFREQLKAQPRVARLFKLLMMPASEVFTKLEMGGTYVDPERLLSRTVKAENTVKTLEVYMDKYQPKGTATINYNSPQQIAAWLFGHLELPIVERTKTNAPSTAESSLLRLADKHKAVNALLKYRKWSKYLSTYLGPWNARRDHKSRIHPSFNLARAVTGRLTSSEPNLQQVPRDTFIRSILGAPLGWRLIEADYSQVELRLAAMAAREHKMLAILAAGGDLHMNTAQAILEEDRKEQIPYGAITKDERVIWGKHPNFGLIFGMKPQKYWEYCRDNGIYITLEDAERTYEVFHAQYPGLRSWHDRMGRLVRANGQVQSAMGRIRHLPDIRSSNGSVRAEAERFAINAPIQGLASDLCLLSAVRLGQSLDHRVARLVGSIHDSILVEVRDDMVDEIVPIVRETMQDTEYVKRKFGTIITVPLLVDVEVSQHWSESS